MNRAIQIIPILFIVLIVTFSELSAQWTSANGIGGTVTCFATTPNGSGGSNIFAGTTDGVILSTDNGISWTSVSNGLTKRSVLSLAVTSNGTGGSNLFAGIGSIANNKYLGNGVFLSTNNGTSWSATSLDSAYVTSLAVNHSDLFAGTMWGVFLSTDNGASWSATGLDSIWVTSLVAKDSNLFAGTYYLRKSLGVTIGGVFCSTDNGLSWKSTNLNKTVYSLAVNDSNIFAGTSQGLYYSKNSSAGWSVMSTFLNAPVTSLTIIPHGEDGATLFAGLSVNGSTFLLRSTDNGASWDYSLPSTNAVVSVVPNGIGGSYLIAGCGEILRSSDDGISWITTNISLTDTYISFLATVPNHNGGTDIMTACGSGLLRSSDDGSTWIAVDTVGLTYGINIPAITAFASAPNASGGTNYYIGGSIKHQPLSPVALSIVCESTNNGTSWVAIDSALRAYGIGPITSIAAVSNGSGGYNILECGISASSPTYISTDNGSSWTRIDPIYSANCFVTNGTNIFDAGGSIYLSTNSGLNWSKADSGITSGVVSLAIKDQYAMAGTGGGGVFLSTNNGTSWEAINNGLPLNQINTPITSLAIVPDGVGGYKFFASIQNSSNIFSTTERYGSIFLSTNFGSSWSDVSSGLPMDAVIMQLVAKPDLNGTQYLYAGTGNRGNSQINNPHGVWRCLLSELVVGVKDQHSQKLTRFSLAQNYPNPFNPTTTISFAIPSKSFVSLKIFDLLGREVTTLVSEELPAGSYSRQWNAANMSCGIYFYRLEACNFVESKKLVLLK